MGGSGLIVVVIVAAWALFLVPQWLHRRAEAASRLADRIPETEDDEATTARRRFGRRELSRQPAPSSAGRRWWRRRRSAASVTVQAGHAATRAAAEDADDVSPERVGTQAGRTSAARRRRVLAVLASATLLTVGVLALAGLVGRPLPTWLVGVPGGLMVAYLLLLALVRPGAPRPVPRPVRQHDDAAAPAAPPSALEATAEHEAVEETEPVADPNTWTPVPLPAPTYVTAPRAPRSVRTIDLSNPGSWTAARAGLAAPAAAGAVASAAALAPPAASGPAPSAAASATEADTEEWVERRRAVGD